MPSNSVVGYIRSPTTGAGINGVTVAIKRHDGATTVTTAASDANGKYVKDHDTVGYPGPVYEEGTGGGTTRIHSGNVWGQIGGLLWAADINDVFALLGIGVAPGAGLTVSANGTDMVLSVAAGTAILKDGCPYVAESARTVTLTAADPTNPRIDRIVLRLTREGQTAQGKIDLVAIAGTPSGSATAPAVTQTAATWDLALAQVRVEAGVTSIAAVGKVTDERTYVLAGTTGDWAVGDDLSVTGDALVTGTLGAQGLASFTAGLGVSGAVANFYGGMGAVGPITLGTAGDQTLSLYAQVKAFGTTPAVSALGGAGTGPTLAIEGTDRAGKVSVTAGTSPTSNTTFVEVTFAAPRADANYAVHLTRTDTNVDTLAMRVTGITASRFRLYCPTALVAGQTYVFFYTVEGFEP